MNLTAKQIEACRETARYYTALADGKSVKVFFNGEPRDNREFVIDAYDLMNGASFRIIEPPKLRPYREEELHELLGVKIRYEKSVFIAVDTSRLLADNLLEHCTFFDGPNAGQPVGKVVE